MIKNIFLLLSLICLYSSILSQNTIIKGNVTDESNNKIANAYVVLLLGSNVEMGTMTDINGNYQIRKIPNGIYKLQCGFVGYERFVLENIIITDDTIIKMDIVLKVVQLESLVVNSYSNPKKRISSKSKNYFLHKSSINSDLLNNSYHYSEYYNRIYKHVYRITAKNLLSSFSADFDNASFFNLRWLAFQSRKSAKYAVRIKKLLNCVD